MASESVVKLFIAVYYLVQYHGSLPADLDRRLRYMITYSDDATASALWTAAAVSRSRDRYGLSGVAVATPNSGYWGATRITADAMAKFLYRAGKDPVVGPWLFRAMQATASNGIDGYNQNLGFNTLSGAGSKQGWGFDNFSGAGVAAVHSVGFGSRYVAAVLQAGDFFTLSVMPGTATVTARLIDRAVQNGGVRISISPTTTLALANRSMHIRARLVDAAGRAVQGQKIRFYSKTDRGGWTYRGVLLSDSGGRASLPVSSGAEGHAWKVVHPGTSGTASADASTIVYVRRAIAGVEALPDRAHTGQVLAVRGRTGAAYVGRKVQLQHITGQGWVSDGASIVGQDGSFRIYFRTPATRNVMYYRAYIGYQAGTYQPLTWSLVDRVVVR